MQRMSSRSVFLRTTTDATLLPKILAAATRANGTPDETAMEELSQRQSMAPLFT